MILRYPLFLVLTFIIISIGIGIGNLSTDNNNFMFVSHRSLLAFAQTNSFSNDENNNNQTQQQQWVDKINNLKILFSSPLRPVIDSRSQIKFEVQNLTTNTNIKDLMARVTIATNSSGQLRTFRYTNISSTNGSFAASYIFPDSGIYQILTRIDLEDSSSLASFNIDVPFQPSNVLNPSSSAFYPMIITVALFGSILGGIGILVMRKRRKK
ncbi:MAG: hypothetical protein ACRD8Z_21050 [Nitrososphaeraceae archaeon]